MFITKGPATALGIARHAIDTLSGPPPKTGAALHARRAHRGAQGASRRCLRTRRSRAGRDSPCLGAHPCVRVVGDLWASLLDGRRQPTERQLALFTTYIRTRLEFAATWCSSSARRQAVERSIKRDRAIAACTTS